MAEFAVNSEVAVMNDAQLVDWLQEQMKHSASGGIVAEVAREVATGKPLRKAVQWRRLERLKESLRIWAAWVNNPIHGYPSMDTIGRVQTFGVGGQPTFCSKPPAMGRYATEALYRLDEIIRDCEARHPNDIKAIDRYYRGSRVASTETAKETSERAISAAADLGISVATLYRRLDRGYALLLQRLDA